MFKIQEGFQIDHVDQGFGVFVDPRDNKEYPYKTFGTQVWMLKDLDYGTRVNVPTSPKGSEMTQTEGTCYKAKDNNNYGNWTEGRAGIYLLPSLSWVAPPGWHVPTLDEWATLQNWMKTKYGTSSYNPAKAMLGATHWVVNSFTPTNDSGFGLLPQGMFEKGWTATGSGSWSYVETSGMTQGRWWTSSSNSEGVNYVVQFYNSSSTYSQTNGYYKTGYNVTGLPVRLIKDTPAASTEPEIESISITIPSSGASDSKLVTEKAVKDYVDSQSGGMQNPMTATGDIIVGGTNGAPDRMALGTTGKILTSTQNGIGWSSGISENATVTIESTGSSNSLLLKGQGGASLASGGDISIDARGGTNHAILKSTTDDGQGGDIVNTSLDIYQGGATLIAGSSPIYLKSDSNNACSSVLIDGNTVVARGNYIGSDRYGDTFSIGDNTGPSLTSQNSITIGTSGVSPISLEASSGTYTASLNLSAASTAGTDSAILSASNGTYTVGLGISVNGATLSSDSGPITISSVRSPIILSAPTVQIPNMSEVDWALNWNACLEVLDAPVDTRYIASYFVNRTGNMDAIILGCYNTHNGDSVTVATYDSTGEETILGSFTVTSNKENPIIVQFTNPLQVTFGQNVRFGFCFTTKSSDTRIYCNNMLTQSWNWRVRTFAGNSGDITWSNGTLVSTLPSIGFHFA